MGVISDGVQSPGNIMRELRQLRREVAELRNERSLESASIGAGGLAVKGGAVVIYDADGSEIMRLSTAGLSMAGLLSVLGNVVVSGGGAVEILDADGDVQVRLGALTSTEGFGLEQLVGNTFVPLAALAGGAEVHVVSGEGTLTESAGSSTSYTDTLDDPGGGTTSGPSFSFTTYTGKWLVLLIAHAGVSTNTAARMSYSTTGAQSNSGGDVRSSLVTDPDTAMGVEQSAIYANVHAGTPGEVTITAQYRCIPPPSSPPANGVASFANRAIIVIPY